MLAAITTTVAGWLASQGASLLLGALANLILQMWRDYQTKQSDKAAAQAEIAQAQAQSAAAAQATISEEAAKPLSEDDTIARMQGGTA